MKRNYLHFTTLTINYIIINFQFGKLIIFSSKFLKIQSSHHDERYHPFLADIKKTYIQKNVSQKINIDDYISAELLTADQIVNTLPANYEPTQLSGELICSLCGKRMYELRESICGCIVCQDCQEKQGNICLVHQVPYKFKQPTEEDYQYYSNLTFQCPYYVCGCDEVLTLRNFMSHMRKCPYAVIKCPYCHIPSPRKNFEQHYKTCQMLPCICKFCNQPLYISQVFNHVEQYHPVCEYCNTRIVNQQDHEKMICPISGCGIQMAKCVLYLHLLDPNNGNLHFQAFNKLIQTSQKQIVQDENTLQQKIKQYNKRKQIIEASQQIKVELKYMRLQTQRLILISQKSQLKLSEFAQYMTLEEKDQLIHELLKRIVEYCMSYDPTSNEMQQYYFLQNNINFIFSNSDSTYQLVINRCNKNQYIDQMLLQTQNFEPQNYFKNVLQNLVDIINQYLVVEDSEDIGQLQRYHNQCYSQYAQLLLYLSSLIQKTQMHQVQKQIIQSTLILFQIAFNKQNDLTLYQYLQNDSSYSIQKIYKDQYNMDYDIPYEKIIELMQLFDLPIIKYVNYDQQMSYLQHSTAKQVLDKIPRSYLQQYDFIFYADDGDQHSDVSASATSLNASLNATNTSYNINAVNNASNAALNASEASYNASNTHNTSQGTSAEQIFIQKLLVRACYYPEDSYASRILIYGGTNTSKFKYLIPQNGAKICVILSENQTQINFEDLIPFNNQIQEIIIKAQQFNPYREIQSQYCLQPIFTSKSLQVLTIENLRFSGVDFNISGLENLIELNIVNCEICYLSQIKLNNKEMRRLTIQVHGSENRVRLYDADCIALAQQINQCKQLQQVSISFNNNFSICPSFIKQLLRQETNNLKRYEILKLEDVQLDEASCQELQQQIDQNNIQIIQLSLSGNTQVKNFMKTVEQILIDSDCEEFCIQNMSNQASAVLNQFQTFDPDHLRIEKVYCDIDKLLDEKIVSENWVKTIQQKFDIQFQ